MVNPTAVPIHSLERSIAGQVARFFAEDHVSFEWIEDEEAMNTCYVAWVIHHPRRLSDLAADAGYAIYRYIKDHSSQPYRCSFPSVHVEQDVGGMKVLVNSRLFEDDRCGQKVMIAQPDD